MFEWLKKIFKKEPGKAGGQIELTPNQENSEQEVETDNTVMPISKNEIKDKDTAEIEEITDDDTGDRII